MVVVFKLFTQSMNFETKKLFEFAVSITHNSKMVGPMAEKSIWILFPIFVSITQFSDFWVISYGNWKHILGVFSFHNSVFNGIFGINLLFSCNVGLFWFFYYYYYYYFETKPSRNVGLFFWKQSNTKLGDERQTGGIGKVWVFLVMSYEWRKLSDEWWKKNSNRA